MSEKERKQAKVFEQVKQGLITQAEAAARLKISDRWARAKIKRYYEHGDGGLVHRGRGKASPKCWNMKHEQLLIELASGEWRGFGPTFVAEKLAAIHGIYVSREVVRKAMIKAGLWSARQRRSKHRTRRERKPMLGMMVQLDGSPHDWFEGRGPKCTLLVYIDDATSKILWLEFAQSESVVSVMQATKNYVTQCGIPTSFYTDYGSVFHVNTNNPENEKKSQWERACAQLGIDVIHATSPQAKGRVERCNKTMQDRLTKELRLARVASIEEANAYLRTSSFIEEHNVKFAVPPTQQGNAHAECALYNLDDIFTVQETRVLANDFTIMYQKRILQLHSQQKTIVRPKNTIMIKTALNGTISLWMRKTPLSFHEIHTKPSTIQEPKPRALTVNKPSENSRRWAAGLLPLKESRVKPAAPAVEAL